MEIYMEPQEELSYHQKTKILAKVCQLFKLLFFDNSKITLQVSCGSRRDHLWQEFSCEY